MDDQEILNSLRVVQTDDTPKDIIRAEEIEYWWWVDLSSKVLYNNTPILNQSLPNTPPTINACGWFSQSKVINEMNFIEWVRPQNNCDPSKFFARTVSDFGGSYGKKWSSLQGNATNAIKSWFLSWTYACWTVAEAKQAIDNIHLICTWSMYVDRRAVFSAWDGILRFTNDPEFYHLFPFIWYDDAKWWFISPSSWGDKRWYKWFFYCYYEDFSKLYSKIACVDQKDSNLLTKAMEDRQLKQKALDMKIWNGLNPNATILQWELESMLSKLWYQITGLEYWKKLTRGEVANQIIKTSKTTNKIWNDTNSNKLATREEWVLMVMRSKWTSIS